MYRSIVLGLMLLLTSLPLIAIQPVFARDPAISPDGSDVCFVYDDDLWIVSFKGGNARRLTFTEGAEWGSAWSPDGKLIAFNSNREGVNYPYIMPSGGGEARVIIRETYNISDWFSDSRHLLGVRHNPRFGSSFYKIPVDGNRPELLAEIGDRFASLSPDNKKIIFNRYGDPYREAYRGSLNGELWQIDLETKLYSKLTNTDFTERYPKHSYINDSFFYCASDGERFQLYRVDGMKFSRPVKVTNFPQWSARDITIARKSDRIVFELFDEIWKYDPTRLFGEKVSKLEINIPEDHWQETRRFDKMKNEVFNFAVSNDELLLGFQYKYDSFFMPRKGGEVKQITFDHAGVSNMEFMEDNRTLVIQKMLRGKDTLFKVNASDPNKLAAVDWFGVDSLVVEDISKDHKGRWIIYYGGSRMSGMVAIADSGIVNIRSINASGPVVSNFAINERGTHAIYVSSRPDYIREIWLYDFATGGHRKIMNDDMWSSSLTWTKDNKSILLTRGGNIFRLDLVPRDEFELDKDNWLEILLPSVKDKVIVAEPDSLPKSDLSDEAGEKPKKAVEPEEPKPEQPFVIEWQDIEKRLYPVILDMEATLFVHSVIDDSTFYYISDGFFFNKPAALKKANIYGKNIKEDFNFGMGAGNYKTIGKAIYYVQNGVIKSFNTSNSAKREIKAEFDYQYDLKILNNRVFEQAWAAFGMNFYDPSMHGRDWEKLFQLYYPYVDKARSIGNIASIVDEMIGDINASHTGFYPRSDSERNFRSSAYLGLELDYSTRLDEGIRIDIVYPGLRLHHYFKLQSGDILTQIDGVRITAGTPIDSLLLDKVGKLIRLTYIRNGRSLEASLKGLSWAEQRRMDYDYKNNRSRDLVNKLSDNRVGYIHIPAMGNRDYENFTRELYRDNADKEALIIDVRGNVGGRIHDQLLTLLMKKHYAYSSNRRRAFEQYPEPFRVWESSLNRFGGRTLLLGWRDIPHPLSRAQARKGGRYSIQRSRDWHLGISASGRIFDAYARFRMV